MYSNGSPTIIDALNVLRPGAQWSIPVPGNDYNLIDWHDDVQIQPTEDEINAEIVILIQTYLREQITNMRTQKIIEGCTVTLTGGKIVPLTGRQEDLTDLQGLAFGAQLRVGQGDTTTLTPFRDANNVIQNLTPLEILELWSSGAAYVSSLYEASWTLKDSDPVPDDWADASHWPTAVWPQPA
jgi:hypothetical protein